MVDAIIPLQAGRELRLYRIIAADEPVEADFFSAAAKHVADLAAGRQPRRMPDTADTLHMWSGVSVYGSRERARAIGEKYWNLGRFIAALVIASDADDTIRIEKTGRDDDHFTLWAPAKRLEVCVELIERI